MTISGNDYAAHIKDRDQAEVQARQDFAEQEFIDNREDLASDLAAGAELYACGNPLLAFDDLEDRVYSEYSEQLTAAFKFCMANPAAGGAAIASIFESAAQDVIDDFESAFRADYEMEYEMTGVAA